MTRETSEVHFNKRKPREEKEEGEEREESVDGLGLGWITVWGEV